MKADIPRDQVAWFPTIDYEACIGDRACLDFCTNSVFEWNAADDRVAVVRPLNCVIGCTSCAKICPPEAITFPDPEELKQTLRRLRAARTPPR